MWRQRWRRIGQMVCGAMADSVGNQEPGAEASVERNDHPASLVAQPRTLRGRLSIELRAVSHDSGAYAHDSLPAMTQPAKISGQVGISLLHQQLLAGCQHRPYGRRTHGRGGLVRVRPSWCHWWVPLNVAPCVRMATCRSQCTPNHAFGAAHRTLGEGCGVVPQPRREALPARLGANREPRQLLAPHQQGYCFFRAAVYGSSITRP